MTLEERKDAEIRRRVETWMTEMWQLMQKDKYWLIMSDERKAQKSDSLRKWRRRKKEMASCES